MIRAPFLAALAALCLGQTAQAQTGTVLRTPDNTTAYKAMDQATGDQLKAGVGQPSDGVYTGSGSASALSVAKGSYAKIEAIRALLAAPLGVTQSGAWSVGISGTLPAFASTPTVNLGTIAGAATDAKLEAVRALIAAQPAGTSGAPVYQVPAALPASGVTPVTGTLASNTISSTFAPTAGRMFYGTLYNTGSTVATVIYSRDAGATWAAEATGVDGSAPIVTNKVAYAGVPIRIPLVVTETGVLVALCPGSMTSGTACSGTVTGTVSFAFSQ